MSVLAFGTQVRGFKPGRSRRIFRAKQILSAPSFGGEVKPSVPCRKFTACKINQNWRWSRHFRQNSRKVLAHSSTFRCWGSLASFQTWGTPGGGGWNVLNHWSSKLGGFDVPLATALCKNLPAENAQRWLNRSKPTRVAVPIEKEEESEHYRLKYWSFNHNEMRQYSTPTPETVSYFRFLLLSPLVNWTLIYFKT